MLNLYSIGSARSFMYADAVSFLNDMADVCIKSKYPCVDDVFLNSSKEDSFIGYLPSIRPRSNPHMICEIGIAELSQNMNSDGYVRDVDVVWAAKHISHEARHAYQMQILYQQSNLSGRDLDMARMAAIGSVFDGYRLSTYDYSPFELDADKHGFIDTVDYFEDWALIHGFMPVINVKGCLLYRVRELNYFPSIIDSSGYASIVSSFDIHSDDYLFRERTCVLNQLDIDTWSNLFKKYPVFLDVIYGSNDKSGVSYDEKLFSVVLDINSSWADYHRGLDQEVKRIRNVYHSHVDMKDRMLNQVNRFVNTRDNNICEMESRLFAMVAKFDEEKMSNPSIDHGIL